MNRLTTLAAVFLAGCASARPEQQMSVTTAEGRLVPLDSITTGFTVGGVRVILRPNYATDAVAVNLYLLGGTRQLTPETQGIEPMLLRVAEYGSAHYPPDVSRTAWGRTGSRLIVDTESDWTLYGFRGIRQEFDSSWNIFADRLMRPTLATSDVKVVRDRMLASVKRRRDNPDGLVSLLADSMAFAGHSYALEPDGVETSLTTIDSAALARYAREQMVASRMLLVIVGAVSRSEVEAAVTRTLSALPAASYHWTLPTPSPRSPSSVAFTPRPAMTNYILGWFQGPAASDDDYPAFRMATAWLSSRVATAVRYQRGLSYSAGAPMRERGVAAGGIYVTTTNPATVMPLVKLQVDALRNLPTGYSMRPFAEQFIMEYFAENSTNAAQADFLARAELYRGDFHKASQSMEDLRHVTMSGIRLAANKYFRQIHFAYVGDTTRVTRELFTTF
ncbi:MAG TPA: insulinase family protein [Gemmatimonadaceae bacterium]|nr:insulinase family protein [Gemmatimonadaceae bacterium]